LSFRREASPLALQTAIVTMAINPKSPEATSIVLYSSTGGFGLKAGWMKLG
jgi:hypothetical protein